jgi:AGZA family xanthine/uracil permease-like MFS transporter
MLERIFHLQAHHTGVRTEILAGFTTFITMAYIIVVNPAILEAAGIPKGPSMIATILTAAFGTLIMGFYANRPFAIAPYMGENAFVAYTVVKQMGYSWQTALAAIFLGGVLFVILTAFRIRSWLVEAVPEGLKISFAVGIGLFIAFIGLNDTGLVALGVPGAPVTFGHISSPAVLMAVFCLFVMGTLFALRVRGAILISILVTTVLAMVTRLIPFPEQVISFHWDLSEIAFKIDFGAMFTIGFLQVVLVVFILDFVDTMGTLIGASARAGFLDENGNLPGIEKPLMADALGTVFGALMGTTTSGTYIESAAGIEEGGRTGLTSIVVAILFLCALIFGPFLTAVPAFAYGPALMIVGVFMVAPIARLKFDDMTELIPAFFTIVLMSFTYNIGIGMTAGFIMYPFFKLVSGRAGEVPAGLWVLFVLSVLFYILYPLH